MDFVELTSASGHARISRTGAQVLAAHLAGADLLWLSPWAGPAPVRGGVPVCFPWFGRRAGLPSHGFARIRDWQLTEHAADRATFTLDDDAETRALWPHRFHAELAVRLDDSLRFALAVTNTGEAPFEITYALHAYFAVTDARAARVEGLAGQIRREAGHETGKQDGDVTADHPVDAIFDTAPDRLTLVDGDRRVAIDADGMTSAVVWNPGPNDLADVGDHWREFVCVERGRVGAAAVTVDPGAQHRSWMRLG